MFERQVSVSCLVAYSLWFAATVLWVLLWAWDSRPLATASIIVAMAAGTATIRTYFLAQSERIKRALKSTGVEASVRSVR